MVTATNIYGTIAHFLGVSSAVAPTYLRAVGCLPARASEQGAHLETLSLLLLLLLVNKPSFSPSCSSSASCSSTRRSESTSMKSAAASKTEQYEENACPSWAKELKAFERGRYDLKRYCRPWSRIRSLSPSRQLRQFARRRGLS